MNANIPQPAWNKSAPYASLIATAEYYHVQAMHTFLEDKTHAHILFLITEEHGVVSVTPLPPDVTDKQILNGVKQAIRDHNLYAVITIAEAWTYFPKSKQDHTVVQLMHNEMRVADLRDADKVECLYGEKAVKHHVDNSKALEAEGKYLTMLNGVGESRVLKMSETLSGRLIETEIIINYPTDRGFGGATAFVYIKVRVDGALRMDAPLGYNHGYDLDMPHIQIHSSEHYGYITATVLYAGDYRVERQNGEFHRLWLDSNEQLVIENAKLRRVPMAGDDKPEIK